MGYSRRSCSSSTTRRPRRSSSTRRHRNQAPAARSPVKLLAAAEGPGRLCRRGTRRVDLDDADVVVSSHACGRLTDVVLVTGDRARRASPCCRAATTSRRATAAISSGGSTARLAIDVMRAVRLRNAATTSGRRRSPTPSRRRTGCCSVRPSLTHGNRTERTGRLIWIECSGFLSPAPRALRRAIY